MLRRIAILTICVYLVGSSGLAGVNSKLTIQDSSESIVLSPFLWILEDQKSILTFSDIDKIPENQFQQIDSEAPSFGITESTYWFKLDFESHVSREKTLYFELDYPLMDFLTIHIFENKELLLSKKAGDRLDFSEREINYRNFILPIKVRPDKTYTLIFSTKTKGSNIFPLKMWDARALFEHKNKEQILFGLFFGIMFVMFAYNFFLYLSIRDKSYLYYVLYIVSHTLFQSGTSGISFQYLWPNSPSFSHFSLPLFSYFTILFLVLFTQKFLHVEDKQDKSYYPLLFFRWLAFIFIGLNFILDYNYRVQLGIVLSVSSSLVVFFVGIKSLYQGYRPARLFVLAFSLYLLGIITASMSFSGTLPVNFFTKYGVFIGSVFEVVFFSFALADRINILRKEKEQAAKEVLKSYQIIKAEVGKRSVLQKENEILQHEIKVASEKLIQADKLSSIGQLTAGIGHEIANPAQLIATTSASVRNSLGEIQGRINDILSDTKDPEVVEVRGIFNKDFKEVNEYLENINLAHDRIKDLHQALRSQSRTDTEKATFNIKKLIDEVFVILGPKIRGRHIKVKCADDFEVTFRRSQLGQVFLNLISNSVDSLAESGVERSSEEDILITIQKSGRGFDILIEDCGPGINDELKLKIFDSFFTTKAAGKGTGLGLPIVQKIVKDHGGTIEVIDSKHLGGACFLLKFADDIGKV